MISDSSSPSSNSLWQSPALVLLMTALAFIFLMGLGNAIGLWVATSMGADVMDILNSAGGRNLSYGERQGIRWQSMLGHLLSFTGTAILIAALKGGQ